MTFRERYMAGEADFDEIFDLTDKWNRSDETCTLREYLGLNAEEEDIWISESDDALEEYMMQEKTRKIFFTDLDDTLLNTKKQITPKTRKAVQEVLSAGHYVTITTGRAFPSALHLAHELKLDGKGCYLIAYNGGQIYDIMAEKMLRSVDVTNAQMMTCIQAAKEYGIHIQAYSDTDVIVEADTEEVRAYCAIQHLDYKVVADVKNVLAQGTPKLLAICDDAKKLEGFRDLLQEKVGGELDLFKSSAKYLEIVPKGINKGDAVHFLCQHLGVPVQNSIAAGDQENDLAMITAAGVGCAMANAVESLKAKADYITENDMDHDGVAEILEKFIL